MFILFFELIEIFKCFVKAVHHEILEFVEYFYKSKSDS